MKRYRKKPVVVEAVQLTGDNAAEVAAWCGGTAKEIWCPNLGDVLSQWPLAVRVIDIQTLEGEMRAQIGDYVIRGIKGEFYPCKPDIFEASYDGFAERADNAAFAQDLNDRHRGATQ